MNLESLPKTVKIKKKRLGLGHGSGRGKTAGRGTKGQKARGKIPLYFEGGSIALIKRLPFRRGKGKNKVFKKKPVVINVKALNNLKKGSIVDGNSLIENHLIDKDDVKKYGVKILGDGEITVSLIIKVPISKSAAKKIEKAGGKVEWTF